MEALREVKRRFPNQHDIIHAAIEVYESARQQPMVSVEELSEKLLNMMRAHLDGVFVFSARGDCDFLLNEIFTYALTHQGGKEAGNE